MASRMDEQKIYEKVFCPTKVEFTTEEKDGKKLEVATLSDEQGYSVKISNGHALSRLYYLFSFGLGIPEMHVLEPAAKNEFFTAVTKNHPRKLKVIMDSKKQPISITSSLHKTMKWSDIKKELEAAVLEVTKSNTVEMLGNQVAYKLPLENKYVSAWLNVNTGNNIVAGRSAVRMSTRFRTEYDTASGGVQAPCHNWCNLWQVPLKMFNAQNLEMRSIYKALGIENIRHLSERAIHLTNSGLLDKERFVSDLKNFMAALEKFQVVIEQSINTPLNSAEIENILWAYDKKVSIPEYIQKAIMGAVKEKTVWGFAQAVSYVRTHGELKVRNESIDKNNLGMVRKLENISGEILSLSPAIQKIKADQGEITKTMLIPMTAVPAATPAPATA